MEGLRADINELADKIINWKKELELKQEDNFQKFQNNAGKWYKQIEEQIQSLVDTYSGYDIQKVKNIQIRMAKVLVSLLTMRKKKAKQFLQDIIDGNKDILEAWKL